jgi:hypothetical protein
MKYDQIAFLEAVLTLPLSREDVQSALEVEFESGDHWFFEVEERRFLILEKLEP